MSCLGACAGLSYLLGRNYTINGRSYSLVRRIGEGGFSYVELVSREGRKYALKRMLLQVPEQWAAAEREVRMHGQLQHRNILQLLDSELAGERSQHGTAYLLFPYCRYGTMQDLMERSRGNGEPLSERRILKLFVSVCRGLRAMHGCSTGPVAHRDVKPSNLLLADSQDELLLMDLGSAAPAELAITNRREAIALQEECAQTCSAHFRAPELFEVPSECCISSKTDVWSLGCSLYAAAFGQSPCDGSALAAMSGRITFPRSHPYSEAFCELVLWILRVEAESRPTVAQAEDRIASLLDRQG